MLHRIDIPKTIADSSSASAVFINRSFFSKYYLGTLLSQQVNKLQGELGTRMSKQKRARLLSCWGNADGKLAQGSSLAYTRKTLLDPILNLLGFEELTKISLAAFHLEEGETLPPGYRLYTPPNKQADLELPLPESETAPAEETMLLPFADDAEGDEDAEDEHEDEGGAYSEEGDEASLAPGTQKVPGVLFSLLPWGQDFDQTFPARSRRRDTPARLMERLLANGPLHWGLLFNGKRLRLMKSTVIAGRQQYFEVDLAALCENGSEQDFGIFWMLFRAQAFQPAADGRCLLDVVDEESRKHAMGVSADLKFSVYGAVETLMSSLVERATELMRQEVAPEDAAGLALQRSAQEALDNLKQLYEESLVYLYRLLFVFYAESRQLLPIAQPIYRDSYSLEPLRDEIEQAGRTYSPSKYRLWETLQALFRLIRNGCNTGQLIVPAYNGSLFRPANTTLLDALRVSDKALKEILSHLSQTRETKGRARERIDYSDLGVEQLGSVYEGLLEFEPRIAREPMVEVSYKGNRVVIPARNNQRESELLPLYPVVRTFATGKFYLGRGAGRKVSGSYYTPQPLVDFLVRRTLEPLIKDRSAAQILELKVVDPAMGSGAFLVGACLYLAREYARARKAEERSAALALRPDVELHPQDEQDAESSEVEESDLNEEESDEVEELEEQASVLDTNLSAEDEELSEEETLPYRRLVAEHCLYGVDLNPMAVELARVSLWLTTLAGDKPLTFLDANLRCGNSLIGAPLIPYRGPSGTEYFAERIHPEALKRLAKAYGKKLAGAPAGPRVDPTQVGLFKGQMPATVAPILNIRRWIAETPSDTIEQVHIKEGFMQNLEGNAQRQTNKNIGDLWVASWFWRQPATPDSKPKEKTRRGAPKAEPQAHNLALFSEFAPAEQESQEASATAVQTATVPEHETRPALNGQIYADLVKYFKDPEKEFKPYMSPFLDEIKRIAEQVRPFHWELEFPEVFLNDNETKREQAGFDAVLGNPPWDTILPNSLEFFSAHDPAFRELERATAEKRASDLLNEIDIHFAWESYVQIIDSQVDYIRMSETYPYQVAKIDGKQTRGHFNTYKLFLEKSFNLLRREGSCGMIIPSGLYSDQSSTGLRKLFFSQTKINHLFSFENRKKIFPIDIRFKFALFGFQKAPSVEIFDAVFMLQELTLLADSESHVMHIPSKLIQRLSPDTLSIMEFRKQKDINTIANLYQEYPLLGENTKTAWTATFRREFNITDDRPLFNSEKKGLPLYGGKLIHQFTHRFGEPDLWIEPSKAREELGRLEIQRVEEAIDYMILSEMPFKQKTSRQVRIKAFLEAHKRGPLTAKDVRLDAEVPRLAIRKFAGSTNERSLITTILPPNTFAIESINYLIPWRFDAIKAYNQPNDIVSCYEASLPINLVAYLCGVLNSFSLDYALRFKVNATINIFYVYQLPVPRLTESDIHCCAIARRVARLVCVGPEFDDLRRELLGDVHSAVLPFEEKEARQQVQNEIDALVAHLYGLSAEDLEHILYAPYTFPLVRREIKDGVMHEFARVESLLEEA